MKTILSIIAIALLLIAGNLTYTNFPQEKSVSPAETAKKVFAQEQIVEVIGKYATQFDSMESQTGFLVKTANNGLQVVPFDKGSMANAMATPPYLQVLWESDMNYPIVVPGTVR